MTHAFKNLRSPAFFLSLALATSQSFALATDPADRDEPFGQTCFATLRSGESTFLVNIGRIATIKWAEGLVAFKAGTRLEIHKPFIEPPPGSSDAAWLGHATLCDSKPGIFIATGTLSDNKFSFDPRAINYISIQFPNSGAPDRFSSQSLIASISGPGINEQAYFDPKAPQATSQAAANFESFRATLASGGFLLKTAPATPNAGNKTPDKKKAAKQ